MTWTAAALALFAVLWSASASAAELWVFTAGAIEPGLQALVADFRRETGTTVQLTVAVPAVLRQRVEAGETPDVLIAPTPVIDALVQSGRLDAEGRALVGRVGVGVVVQSAATPPHIATHDGLIQSLLAADALVYNRASTGIYFERLLERLGIAERVKDKTVRYADGVLVMEHLLRGPKGEIGIGAITEIKAFEAKGLRFVGPLPTDLQNYTSYFAAVPRGAASADGGRNFIRFITSAPARAAFAATGVE
jgi:molybdate transport system substrate-binding protein